MRLVWYLFESACYYRYVTIDYGSGNGFRYLALFLVVVPMTCALSVKMK